MPMLRLLCITLLIMGNATAKAQTDVSEPLGQSVIYPKRTASATALSLNDTRVSAQLLAKVVALPVRVSQAVKKGDVLARLDCADYRLKYDMSKASLKAAKARLTLAHSQLSRAQQLRQKNLSSQEQVDIRIADAATKAAEFTQSEVTLKQDKLNVERCTIKSPFDGVVTERLAAEGQLASVGTPIVSVVETGVMELSASVSYAAVKELTTIESFAFDFGPLLAVKLHNIGGVVDSKTRTTEARFVFVDEKALPGTAGKLVWSDPKPHIPAKLVVRRNGSLGVFLDVDGVAKFVRLDNAIPGRPVPTSLPLESLIVTDNLAVLENGKVL